jgi:hypothetical protein
MTRRESHTEQVGAKLTKSLNAQLRETCRRLDISLNEGLIRAITRWLADPE